MVKYPHLDGNESDFPDLGNVNVYEYDNQIDYSRFDYSQMRVQVCSVPWDMGEAHIGARTISGIGNVVFFGTEAKRDAWFDAIPDSHCYRFDTKYRNLHRTNGSQGEIRVPLPFDVACQYNYVAVSYEMVANANSPLQYENSTGKRKWFWFIREVESVAPNTTILHLMLDAWQTFIYGVTISNMILERGHAPMIATKTDSYLADPIGRCSNLLAEDVNFGEANITTKTASHVFNTGTMYACIVTAANAYTGSWGTKAAGTWQTPARFHFQPQGGTGSIAFAIPAANLTTFLNQVDVDAPQFAQCIQGVFFASADLLTLGTSFTFCGQTCQLVSADYHQINVHSIAKSDFGYPSKYADMAKLYTWPYAYIRLTDENGDGVDLHVEDTDGTVKIEQGMSVIYPWININAHVSSTGKAVRRQVSFTNATTRNMPIGGNWHELLMSWDVPVFGVFQDAKLNNDYGTHFDRAQNAFAASNDYANAIASATATQTNEVNSAGTARDNAYNDAANVIATGNLQVTLNNAQTTVGNTRANADSLEDQMLSAGLTASASVFTSNTTNNQIDYQYATGAIAAASSAVSGAISGGTTMAAGGPVGAAVGALAGGLTGGVSSVLSTAAGVNFASAQASESQNQMSRNNTASQTNSINMTSNAITKANADNTASNAYTTGSSAQSAGTIRSNANNSYSTDTTNAANTYNANSANASRNLATRNQENTNQVNQAALGAPVDFGTFSDGQTVATKPMGVFSNVITQNDYAIACAGDEFARYGYMLNRQWSFDGDWNVGKYFTYWKLSDFWVTGLSTPDMYMDMLRFFLYGGVTVWRSPEHIGNIDIYENMEV